MAKPIFLPTQKTTLQRLFAEMPQSFSDDPQSVPSLDVCAFIFDSDYGTSSATISFLIADGVLSINSLLPYILSENIVLSKYTINDLISYFNLQYKEYGIKIKLNNSTAFYEANISASTLLEGIYELPTYSDSNSSIFYTEIDRFTSTNYALLMAISLGLIDNEHNMKAALRQTDLRLSQNEWIDYWGNYLGIPRGGDEIYSDENYRNRIQFLLTYPKSNNIALEHSITMATGRRTSVIDGGNPIVLSGSTLFSNSSSGSGLTVNTATAASGGAIQSATINSAGSGYLGGKNGTLYFAPAGGGGTGALFSMSVTKGVPSGSVSVLNSGENYSTNASNLSVIESVSNSGTIFPTVGGSGFTVNITSLNAANHPTNPYGIAGLSIGTPGMGYHNDTTTTFTMGFTVNGGSAGLCTCTVSVIDGVPTGSITITNAGQNYSIATNVEITQTTTTGNTLEILAYKLGPTTGAGSFIVYVGLYETEKFLPQPAYSSISILLHKLKPAGIPFVLKTATATEFASQTSAVFIARRFTGVS